ALLPLLHSRIEVGDISIDGLAATVERRKDGTTSIDDLIKRDNKAAQPGKPPSANATPDFEVGGIELTNADFTFNDLETKRTVHLSKVMLKTVGRAPVVRTPLKFETTFDVTEPQSNGKMTVSTTLDLDLAKQIFAAADLEAGLSAVLDKQPVEVSVVAAHAAY